MVSLSSFFFFFSVCWAALCRLPCPRALGLFIETQCCLYSEGRAEQADSPVVLPKFRPDMKQCSSREEPPSDKAFIQSWFGLSVKNPIYFVTLQRFNPALNALVSHVAHPVIKFSDVSWNPPAEPGTSTGASPWCVCLFLKVYSNPECYSGPLLVGPVNNQLWLNRDPVQVVMDYLSLLQDAQTAAVHE